MNLEPSIRTQRLEVVLDAVVGCAWPSFRGYWPEAVKLELLRTIRDPAITLVAGAPMRSSPARRSPPKGPKRRRT